MEIGLCSHCVSMLVHIIQQVALKACASITTNLLQKLVGVMRVGTHKHAWTSSIHECYTKHEHHNNHTKHTHQ